MAVDAAVYQPDLDECKLPTCLDVVLTNIKSIPYNATGDNYIHTALIDPIDAALNFGAIQAGVVLSSLQKSEVNAAAGVAIDQVLSTRGWYLQVLPSSPTTRQARQSSPVSFWYTDGGSVNKISMASVDLL